MPDNTLTKRKPSMGLNEILEAVDAGIVGSVRAMLISRCKDGFVVQEVRQGESVLNISKDLVNHLNERPYPDEWLNRLKESIDQRMTRRRHAGHVGALSIPGENGWGPITKK